MADNLFKKKMEEKNETQLLRVINNQQQFRPQAVEAAKEVLKQRRVRKEKRKQQEDAKNRGGP